MDKNPKVSVVIPFYQKEKGILKKALSSVFNQKNFNNYEIIVVDDGSPVPATEELADLPENKKQKIKVIRTENKGPGAARNRGINAISKQTKYIAFLDSDDEWSEAHLENAIFALEKGYDFYFSDIKVVQSGKSHFEYIKAIGCDPSKHIRIDRDLHVFTGKFLEAVLKEYLSYTSTVVYRYSSCSDLRFEEALYNGQDSLFWLNLALRTDKVVFSNKAEAFMGRGVNIWAASRGWDNERYVTYTKNILLLHKYLIKFYTSLPEACKDKETWKMWLKNRNEARINFIITYLHMVRLKRKLYARTLIEAIKNDLIIAFLFLPVLLKIIFKKIEFYVN